MAAAEIYINIYTVYVNVCVCVAAGRTRRCCHMVSVAMATAWSVVGAGDRWTGDDVNVRTVLQDLSFSKSSNSFRFPSSQFIKVKCLNLLGET